MVLPSPFCSQFHLFDFATAKDCFVVGQLNTSLGIGICGVQSVVGEKSTNVNKGEKWPCFVNWQHYEPWTSKLLWQMISHVVLCPICRSMSIDQGWSSTFQPPTKDRIWRALHRNVCSSLPARRATKMIPRHRVCWCFTWSQRDPVL